MQPKRTVMMLLIAACLTALPACWTYSLHPVAEDNDPHLIYDPTLEGTWQFSHDKSEPLLVISGDAKSLAYSLQMVKPSEENCNCSPGDVPDIRYDGRLVQLEANRFLDAFPRGDAQGVGSFPSHTFLKISVAHDSMSLSPPSDEWLCNQSRLKLGECINGDFLVTVPTDVLQAFLQKHGSDKELFPEPGADDFLERVKPLASEK